MYPFEGEGPTFLALEPTTFANPSFGALTRSFLRKMCVSRRDGELWSEVLLSPAARLHSSAHLPRRQFARHDAARELGLQFVFAQFGRLGLCVGLETASR